MRLILHYLKRYKGWLLLDVISVFGFALTELGIPTLVSEMIDRGVVFSDTGVLFEMGGIIALISVIGVCGTLLLGYCCARISTRVTEDMRNDLFAHIQSFSHSEYNQFGTSSLITRTNNDAFQLQMFINVILRTALMTPVMIVVSMFMVTRTSLQLSLVIAATIPVIIIGVFLVARLSEPISTRQQRALDGMNRVSRENLTGIRVIRAFNNDKVEKQRFDEINQSFTRETRRLYKLMSYTQPIFFLLMNLAGLAIFWIASQRIDAGLLQVGKLVAFMEYLFHAMFSMMLFCTVFMQYPRAQVSASRIREVLNTVPRIQNPEAGVQDGPTPGILEFDHVTFVYPDSEEAVLKDISFIAHRGQTIAFIGSTGSGKSTLVNLIPRFYDVAQGSIRVNGQDVRRYDLSALRKKIGFIAQKAFLFNGTIRENLRYGKSEATDQELMAAAKIAQAEEFILEKPGGLDEPITENATNVSGGQRQRLSIARALVRKPEIYIFDDSFSALDFRTDAALRQALKPHTREAIVCIVAQRVSSIMDADQIIVLNEGRVVGRGTHRKLLKNCPIYHEIAASQLSEEELAYE